MFSILSKAAFKPVTSALKVYNLCSVDPRASLCSWRLSLISSRTLVVKELTDWCMEGRTVDLINEVRELSNVELI